MTNTILNTLKKKSTNKILRTAEELIPWTTFTDDGCITINKDAPFLNYKNNKQTKPVIDSVAFEGDNARFSKNSYGIQHYAWVMLGEKEMHIKEGTFSTTCGNELCMNPDHIVWTPPKTTRVVKSSPKKPVTKTIGANKKLDEFEKVNTLAMSGLSNKQIAMATDLSESKINCLKRKFVRMHDVDVSYANLLRIQQYGHAILDTDRKMSESPNNNNNNDLFDM